MICMIMKTRRSKWSWGWIGCYGLGKCGNTMSKKNFSFSFFFFPSLNINKEVNDKSFSFFQPHKLLFKQFIIFIKKWRKLLHLYILLIHVTLLSKRSVHYQWRWISFTYCLHFVWFRQDSGTDSSYKNYFFNSRLLVFLLFIFYSIYSARPKQCAWLEHQVGLIDFLLLLCCSQMGAWRELTWLHSTQRRFLDTTTIKESHFMFPHLTCVIHSSGLIEMTFPFFDSQVKTFSRMSIVQFLFTLWTSVETFECHFWFFVFLERPLLRLIEVLDI